MGRRNHPASRAMTNSRSVGAIPGWAERPLTASGLRDTRRNRSYRPIVWNSSFGRMSANIAIRFERLKKAVTEAMSQMASSE